MSLHTVTAGRRRFRESVVQRDGTRTFNYAALPAGAPVWACVKLPGGELAPLPGVAVHGHDGTLPRVTVLVRDAEGQEMQFSVAREHVSVRRTAH